jgi:hypothetical protein
LGWSFSAGGAWIATTPTTLSRAGFSDTAATERDGVADCARVAAPMASAIANAASARPPTISSSRRCPASPSPDRSPGPLPTPTFALRSYSCDSGDHRPSDQFTNHDWPAAQDRGPA